jgi:hypothetical protein
MTQVHRQVQSDAELRCADIDAGQLAIPRMHQTDKYMAEQFTQVDKFMR